MNKKNVMLVLLGCSITLIGVITYRYFFKSWIPYYQEKLYKEPRPLLVQATELVQINSVSKALDLGAGAGNETAFLLKNGWHIWSIDKEPEAIKVINNRKDIEKYKDNLITIHASFSNLPWNILPEFDLIYAGYSLPFADNFIEIWEKIVDALPSGGIFVGNFFGPKQGNFNWWTQRKMNFLTEQQVLGLFSNFHIEYFKHYYEKDAQGIWDDSFDVIARKR